MVRGREHGCIEVAGVKYPGGVKRSATKNRKQAPAQRRDPATESRLGVIISRAMESIVAVLSRLIAPVCGLTAVVFGVESLCLHPRSLKKKGRSAPGRVRLRNGLHGSQLSG